MCGLLAKKGGLQMSELLLRRRHETITKMFQSLLII